MLSLFSPTLQRGKGLVHGLVWRRFSEPALMLRLDSTTHPPCATMAGSVFPLLQSFLIQHRQLFSLPVEAAAAVTGCVWLPSACWHAHCVCPRLRCARAIGYVCDCDHGRGCPGDPDHAWMTLHGEADGHYYDHHGARGCGRKMSHVPLRNSGETSACNAPSIQAAVFRCRAQHNALAHCG